MTYVGSITIAILCPALFAVLASVSLFLALQLSSFLAIAVQIGISIPDFAVVLAATIDIIAGVNLSVSIGLPSVTVMFAAGISAQLIIAVGIVAAIDAILNLVISAAANLQAFAYVGAGAGTLGAAIGSALTGGWPDGTPPSSTVNAIIIVASDSGSVTSQQVASVNMLGGGANYDQTPGATTCTFSPPPVGGTTATGTVTVGTSGATAGQITGISVVDAGLGYTSPPTITITDPATGAGAAATPVMGGGNVAQLAGFFDGITFPGAGLGAGVSIGLNVLCGTVFTLLAELLGNMQLQVKILGSCNASIGVVPPTVSGNLTVLAKIKANVQAAIAALPPIPSIQASLSATLAAQIAVIGAIVAKIGLIYGFSTEAVGVYTYSGPGSGLGPTITASFPATSGSVLILAATNPTAHTTLSVFFAGSGV